MDLLPLYAENMTSDDTRLLVEKHLAGCPDCRRELAAMQAPQPVPADTVTAPLQRLRSKLFWSKVEAVVLTAALILAFAITGIAYLTAPEYLPYSDTLLTFHECVDGTLFVSFGEEVVGYDTHSYSATNGEGYVYHITAWTNQWSRFSPAKNTQSLLLKPQQNEALSVYYYLDGVEDTLIFGKDLYAGGGVITLPRLVLGYYVVIAAVLAVGLGLLLFGFRKHEKIRNVVEKIVLLPVSYLLGHLCIKGFRSSSYSALRDFCAILLVMLPLYCAMLLALHLYRRHQLRKQLAS